MFYDPLHPKANNTKKTVFIESCLITKNNVTGVLTVTLAQLANG